MFREIRTLMDAFLGMYLDLGWIPGNRQENETDLNVLDEATRQMTDEEFRTELMKDPITGKPDNEALMELTKLYQKYQKEAEKNSHLSEAKYEKAIAPIAGELMEEVLAIFNNGMRTRI